MDNNILTFIGGIFAVLIGFYIAERRIQMKYITKERAKWRDDIRKKTIELHKAIIEKEKITIDELRTEFAIRLNPNDCNDKKILASIKLAEVGKEVEHALAFSKRIALLLKHDWERSKREASWFSIIHCEPKRTCSD